MHTSDRNKRVWFFAFIATLTSLSLSAGSLEHAIETQISTELSAQKSQENIDNLDDETTSLLNEYRQVISQTESLQAYNEQLDTLVTSQKTELASIDEQLNNIETTQRDIIPLMLKMIEVLGEFVELDIPFLAEERQTRVAQLQALMGRADVSLSEKYRRILEAYQVETEYGRTIEAYQGELDSSDSASRTVDFLRIGRVSLYYLTLDGLEAGLWDIEQKKWQPVPTEQLSSINQGLKVALKQLPPDLLVLPVKKMGAE
jgi:FtsZ-binding cell division protein ZapB